MSRALALKLTLLLSLLVALGVCVVILEPSGRMQPSGKDATSPPPVRAGLRAVPGTSSASGPPVLVPAGSFGKLGGGGGVLDVGIPQGLAVDGADRLYIADPEGHRVLVFEIR